MAKDKKKEEKKEDQVELKEIKEEPKEPKKDEPKIGLFEFPEVQKYKLMNDIKIIVNKTSMKLLAGKIVESKEYDIEGLKSAGAVLVPVKEG